ncbi:MAG: cation diffusion facilitator family transporter [Clostridiales bacterium]|jgi:cation diffusion facilitator family transporter|nr:cation diffusion facilitator family transporter [Clostridiales bacterium]
MRKEHAAIRITAIGIIINAILAALKFAAGVLGHSTAMVSDAVHSMSDIFSSVVVIIGVTMANRQSDEDHQYGHERMECVAAIILAVFLGLAGLGIGYSGIKSIVGKEISTGQIPGLFPLVCAVFSIIVKEAMYWFTRREAQRISSGALMADAWHHRSDALSSVGSLLGIIGARMGYAILDPLASVIICVFIVKVAVEIFIDSVGKMTDRAVDRETIRKITGLIMLQKDVLGVDQIKTRVFGDKIYVDVEISVGGEHTLHRAHDAAERVHDAIESEFPQVKHIMVHMNPGQEKEV